MPFGPLYKGDYIIPFWGQQSRRFRHKTAFSMQVMEGRKEKQNKLREPT